MTKDEQIAALKQAFAYELQILFARVQSEVANKARPDQEVSSEFTDDLSALNKAYGLAQDVINAQP